MIILPTLLSSMIVAIMWARYGFQIAWPSACILILYLAIHVLDRKNIEGSHRTSVRILLFMAVAVMLFSLLRDMFQTVPLASITGPSSIVMMMVWARGLPATQSDNSQSGRSSTTSEAP